MLVTLCPDHLADLAQELLKALSESFGGRVETHAVSVATPTPWPAQPDWDDLLIVLYDAEAYPDSGNDFITEYLKKRKGAGRLLPVSLDAAHLRPPKAAEEVKAFPLRPEAEVRQRLIHRVGAMIGLATQQRDHCIFVSYRKTDGEAMAVQVEEKLRSLGYPVWRDQAQEMDGETKIVPGSPVQKEINKALDGASIVLLLDTYDAPQSVWIKHEVDTATAQLTPILPVCVRRADDPRRRPGFRALQELQRWVNVTAPAAGAGLADADLQSVVAQLEAYLCEIFQRRCRVPYRVEQVFSMREFQWSILDQRFLMCEAIRKHSMRTKTCVVSHCSVFDQVHGPSMDRFSNFLRDRSHNHSLYIYDGELIPEPELQEIIESRPQHEDVVILHHQELAALVDSDFKTFVP